MAKSLLPYIFSAIGLAAVTTGYLVYNNANKPEPSVEKSVEETAPAAEQEVAAVNTEAGNDEDNAKASDALPTFSILRVEPDGSAVIGGTGPASSAIELFDGGVSLGKTKTGPEGDFVFVLDKPLDTGLHELTLEATDESGKKVASSESGIVNVPEAGKPEELTVVVSEPGQATRVLAQGDSQEVANLEADKPADTPKQEEVASESVAAQEGEGTEPTAEQETSQSEETQEQETAAVTEEASSQAEINTDVSEVEVKTETDNVSVSVKKEDNAEPPTEPVKPVLIEAADIEAGRILIAGTGEPGMNVNVYLSGEFLGRTKVSENGAFLFDGPRKVDAGTYEIRADMTGTSENEVIARAQVKLVHEPEVASTQEPAEITKTEESDQSGNETATGSETQDTAVVSTEETSTEPEEETQTAASDESAAEAESEEDKVIRTGTAVIIRRGDNLWRLARRNYGAGIRYTTIFEANRDQIQDPNLIFPGQVFKVPDDDGSGEQG